MDGNSSTSAQHADHTIPETSTIVTTVSNGNPAGATSAQIVPAASTPADHARTDPTNDTASSTTTMASTISEPVISEITTSLSCPIWATTPPPVYHYGMPPQSQSGVPPRQPPFNVASPFPPFIQRTQAEIGQNSHVFMTPTGPHPVENSINAPPNLEGMLHDLLNQLSRTRGQQSQPRNQRSEETFASLRQNLFDEPVLSNRPEPPLHNLNASVTPPTEPVIQTPLIAPNKEIEDLKDLVKNLTSQMHQAIRAAPEIDRVLMEAQNTPFTQTITSYPLRNPGKIQLPTYQGNDDPSQYLATFEIAMGRARFVGEERDPGYCRLFIENLRGDALRWFSRLKPNSISNFFELKSAFISQYLSFVEKRTTIADLWALVQEPKESLRDFIQRFKLVASRVTVPDEAGILALRNNLVHSPRFREDLIVNKPHTFEDALHRAMRFVEVEEENALLAKKINPPRTSSAREKEKQAESKDEPRQHVNREYNHEKEKRIATCYAASERQHKQPWNKFVRDSPQNNPRNNAGISMQDPESYCDFHRSPGHSTRDCRTLTDKLLEKYSNGGVEISRQRQRDESNSRTDQSQHQSTRRPREERSEVTLPLPPTKRIA